MLEHPMDLVEFDVDGSNCAIIDYFDDGHGRVMTELLHVEEDTVWIRKLDTNHAKDKKGQKIAFQETIGLLGELSSPEGQTLEHSFYEHSELKDKRDIISKLEAALLQNQKLAAELERMIALCKATTKYVSNALSVW